MLTSPTSCTGWPEPRTFMEAQQWFATADQDVDAQAAHVHLGACVPWNAELSGNVTFDILLQLHDLNNRQIDVVKVFIQANNKSIDLGKVEGLAWSCTTALCRRVVRVVADTTLVPWDGYTMLRLRAQESYVTPPPKNLDLFFHTNLDVWNNIQNGRTENGRLYPVPIRGQGFASFPWTYQLVSWLKADIPTRPVSGLWNIRRLKTVITTEKGASNITRTVFSIDPAFHATPPRVGKVILDVPGPVEGPLTINTTELTDGRHVLFLRCDSFVPAGTVFNQTDQTSCQDCDAIYEDGYPPQEASLFNASNPFGGGTNSAVLVIAFEVRNNPTSPLMPADREYLVESDYTKKDFDAGVVGAAPQVNSTTGGGSGGDSLAPSPAPPPRRKKKDDGLTRAERKQLRRQRKAIRRYEKRLARLAAKANSTATQQPNDEVLT